MEIVIGTAGWSIAAAQAASFAADGSALERYSRVFGGVEVNSSFHRPHRASTWARWAASVPASFRFAVKIPKAITHEARLVDVSGRTEQFLREVEPLAGKLGLLLVQLPPSLAFDPSLVDQFFSDLRQISSVPIACEPRHASWFEEGADRLLERRHIARVAADPAIVPNAAVPGGWQGLCYWRLHGSPAIYRSSYGDEELDHYASQVRNAVEAGSDAWCMFDNTAASAATGNALSLVTRLSEGNEPESAAIMRGLPRRGRKTD